MPTKVLMPQLGEAIEEATITRWLKSEGDTIGEYEALVEVNTDKVDTEIPSPAAGTLLKIVQPLEGAIVEVGMLLAWIGEPDESIPIGDTSVLYDDRSKPQDVEIKSKETDISKADPFLSTPSVKEPTSDPKQNLGFISPIVAKIAAKHSVNLEQVRGTGLNGRITKGDILVFIEARDQELKNKVLVKSSNAQQITNQASFIPHSTIRQRIAKHMVMSKRTSPHVTTVFEADLSKIIAHKTLNKDSFANDGARLTLTAYFIAAAAAGLMAFPMVNSSWTDEGLVLHNEVNIGMATSLGEQGLIVPVIKNANDLSLLGITRSVNDLAKRARGKQLQPDEVIGGTFTITNHGMSGSLFAMPIINQPQCAILGVGKLQKRVIVLEDYSGYDTISIRPMVYLTLTFDHRILDGAIADYFLSKVVETLEKWT